LNAGSRGTERLLVEAPGLVLNADALPGPAALLGFDGGAAPGMRLPGIAASRAMSVSSFGIKPSL
jgi:hypothetical protein